MCQSHKIVGLETEGLFFLDATASLWRLHLPLLLKMNKWNLVLQKWSQEQLVSSKESEIKISISPCSVSQFCQISRLSHSVQKGALEISSKIVGAVAQLAPMLSLPSHNSQRPLLSCVTIFSLHRLPSTLSALSFNSFFATLCNQTAFLRVNSR